MSTFPNRGPRRARNPMRLLAWGGAALFLLLPALAMRAGVPGVSWTASDFAVAGLMLAAACALYELATWLSASTVYRAGFALAVATGLLTVWANLAVGMFGREGDPLNLVFVGVLLVAATGALWARFQPRRMARAMAATAAAQLVAAAIGLALGLAAGPRDAGGPSLAREVLLVAAFALPWAGAAALFAWSGSARRGDPARDA